MTTTAESNRLRFTATALRDLEPPTDRERVYFYDTHPKAPEGFCLCVTGTGRKTFYLYARVNGRPKRENLGLFSKPGNTGGALTVEQARKLAVEKAGKRAAGVDTFAESQARRRQLTFGEAFDLYLAAPTPRRKKPKSEKTVYEYTNQRDLYLSGWTGHRLSAISRGMVRKLHDHIAGDLEKPTMANRVVGLVRSVYNHAITREDVEVMNPALGFERAEETPRDRRLSASELPRFLRKVEADKRSVMVDALMVTLYTAQRCGNVLAMAWDEVDMKTKTWTIPADKTKTRREYVVHLAPQVLAILSRRKLKAGEHPYVFPGRRRGRHLTTLRYVVNDAVDAAKLGDLNVHDLRRTARSLLGDAGVPDKYGDAVTAHDSGNAMRKVYNRADAELVRLAFCVLADAIDAAKVGEALPDWSRYLKKATARKVVQRG